MSTLYAVVDGKYLLPLDKALEVLKLLADAERVETTYRSADPYKVSSDGNMPHLTVISAAQFAALKLIN